MRLSYSPGYYADIGEEHIFPMGKFDGTYRYLLDHGVIAPSQIIEPSMAAISDLMSVHTHRYVQAICTGGLEKREERRLGLPWSHALSVRSRLAVQGSINASLMALQDGLAGNIAGGTHHAFPDHGEGFCVYNDVAVAIQVLKRAMWVRRVLVIDCDVHQGNGTAHIFADDPEVYTLSIHGQNNYPFRKPASDRDVGLPDGTGDDAYLQALDETLEQVLGEFEPDLVYYLGGIDPLQTDHFGRLSLSLQGLQERDRTVIRRVTGCDHPLVILMSGGYAPTLQQTIEAHALMYRAAAQLGYER